MPRFPVLLYSVVLQYGQRKRNRTFVSRFQSAEITTIRFTGLATLTSSNLYPFGKVISSPIRAGRGSIGFPNPSSVYKAELTCSLKLVEVRGIEPLRVLATRI